MPPFVYRLLLVAALLSLLALAGCSIDVGPTGPAETENRSVDLDQSELVRVQLKMGAGELSVRGGAAKLMEGEFTYNRPRLRPEIRYDATGFRGHLVVQEPSNVRHTNSKYRWNIRLNDAKPMDLVVDFGAGDGRLDLGSLALRSVEIHMGVGELRLDLRGTPKNDYTVSVRGGVGEVTIYLPDGVGIVADAQGGIGGISARGLQKRDGRFVNDGYGHSKVTVRLDIRGGIGAINLVGG